MGKGDDQYARIDAIVGEDGGGTFEDAAARFFEHLKAHLQLPCEVKGAQDFQWEEAYVLGGASPKEYARLKETQPSYSDVYRLVSIKQGVCSKWMMRSSGEIAANVERIKDGKKFVLGLSELKVKDKKSANFKLVDDFGVFFLELSVKALRAHDEAIGLIRGLMRANELAEDDPTSLHFEPVRLEDAVSERNLRDMEIDG